MCVSVLLMLCTGQTGTGSRYLGDVTPYCCSSSPGVGRREKKYKAHLQFGDRRGGVISARTYFYADEAKCDSQMETFLNCIKASGRQLGLFFGAMGRGKC